MNHFADDNYIASYEFGDVLLGMIAIMIPLIALLLLFS